MLAGSVACADRSPTGPLFQASGTPSEQRTLVYVYRIDKMAGVGPIKVRMDGGAEFELKNGEYAPLYVRAGARKLSLKLPLIAGISRGWNSIPFTAVPGETQYLRIWGGVDEIDRGPPGRPDDFGAPGRSSRYASVNVFGALWSTRESERDIRSCQRTPDTPSTRR